MTITTTTPVLVFLSDHRIDNITVLSSMFGPGSLRGMNTLDHNNAIGRYIRTYAIHS